MNKSDAMLDDYLSDAIIASNHGMWYRQLGNAVLLESGMDSAGLEK